MFGSPSQARVIVFFAQALQSVLLFSQVSLEASSFFVLKKTNQKKLFSTVLLFHFGHARGCPHGQRRRGNACQKKNVT